MTDLFAVFTRSTLHRREIFAKVYYKINIKASIYYYIQTHLSEKNQSRKVNTNKYLFPDTAFFILSRTSHATAVEGKG